MDIFRLCSLLTLGIVGVLSEITLNQTPIYKFSGSVNASGEGHLGIYKGKTTSIKKHPYLVAINFRNDLSCDGVIIHKRWVLTLGDCLNTYKKKTLKVVAGSTDGLTGKTFKVAKVEVHPSYGTGFLDYDYGLLKIKGRFQWSHTVRKAYLPKKEPGVKSKAVVVGWTPTSTGYVLEEGSMEVISRKTCEEIYQSANITLKTTPRISCLYAKNNTSPCAGDISDLVMEGRKVIALFSGVGAKGECSSKALPAITADLHAALPWIKDITKIKAD